MPSILRWSGILLAVLLLGHAPAVSAAEPERLGQRPFEVLVSGSTVEVTFTLALSDAGTYPVVIVAVRGSQEEKLWEGSLSDGIYRLRTPLTQISGPGPLTVALRTRIVSRASGASFTPYLTWEGAIDR